MTAPTAGDLLLAYDDPGLLPFANNARFRIEELLDCTVTLVDAHKAKFAANDDAYRLFMTSAGLELRFGPAAAPRQRPLRVDWTEPSMLRRLRGQAGREPLVQALKGKAARTAKPEGPVLIDATAGLGIDSAIAASRGFLVIAIERHPLLAAVLNDGIERARQDPRTADIAARLHLVAADARHVLEGLAHEHDADVVYLDPMFAGAAPKSALPKGSMQGLRCLLGETTAGESAAGDDDDAIELLKLARGCARRVVVKRPPKAGPVGGIVPTRSTAGESCRFDVYTKQGKAPLSERPVT